MVAQLIEYHRLCREQFVVALGCSPREAAELAFAALRINTDALWAEGDALAAGRSPKDAKRVYLATTAAEARRHWSGTGSLPALRSHHQRRSGRRVRTSRRLRAARCGCSPG